MRPAAILLLVLTACSAEPPSGPAPLPQPAPTLPPQGTRALPFEGEYELSVSLAPECARAFPVEARVRRYAVGVLDAGDRSLLDFLDARVADSVGDGPGFSSEAVLAGADAARLRLHFAALLGYSRGDRGYPRYLWLEAVSLVPIVAEGLEGRLSGRFTYEGEPGSAAECTSDRHDFYLRPR